jgi:hypothetical protein
LRKNIPKGKWFVNEMEERQWGERKYNRDGCKGKKKIEPQRTQRAQWKKRRLNRKDAKTQWRE